MWGRHVENELHQSTKKAKTDAQAQSRAMLAMKRLMTDPTEEEDSETPAPVPTGQFRDPAARFTKKE